jgi:hypothetical protein
MQFRIGETSGSWFSKDGMASMAGGWSCRGEVEIPFWGSGLDLPALKMVVPNEDLLQPLRPSNQVVAG